MLCCFSSFLIYAKLSFSEVLHYVGLHSISAYKLVWTSPPTRSDRQKHKYRMLWIKSSKEEKLVKLGGIRNTMCLEKTHRRPKGLDFQQSLCNIISDKQQKWLIWTRSLSPEFSAVFCLTLSSPFPIIFTCCKKYS